MVHDGAKAIEFYKEAFGAEELGRMTTPDGRLMHGEIRLAGHRVFISDEFDPKEGGTVRAPRTLGGTCVRLMIETESFRRPIVQPSSSTTRFIR